MRKRLLIFLLAFSTLALAADQSADRDALLKLHAQDRDGHLKGYADLIVAPLAPTVLEIVGGHVRSVNREDARRNFADQLKGVKFTAWDDLAEPIIKISSDGQIAWMIVQTKVEEAPADHPDDKRSFVSSAIQTFEKAPNGWQMTAIAVTMGR